MITKEMVINAIYNSAEDWTCPGGCPYGENECRKCAERLLEEYEVENDRKRVSRVSEQNNQ